MDHMYLQRLSQNYCRQGCKINTRQVRHLATTYIKSVRVRMELKKEQQFAIWYCVQWGLSGGETVKDMK